MSPPGLLWVTVLPKHTDHEWAPTPDAGQIHRPRSTLDDVTRSIPASTLYVPALLFRTTTAPCTLPPLADRTAQTCATTLVPMVWLAAQCHVLELEVIGLVLP
ncbi:hypothetical protein [Actinophytocola sp. KF-1]